MAKVTLKDLDVKGKHVIVRVDFNVPHKNGVITDDNRVRAALPTINYLTEHGAKVMLLSHLGKVKTEEDKAKNDMSIVADCLAALQDAPVTFVNATRGEEVEAAVKAQREVSELTNDILRKNSEKLKTATIETAKESERGVVDMETLKYTNEQLITTLEEVTRIQDEGRQKRRDAEIEIQRMEDELKQKLLSMRPGQGNVSAENERPEQTLRSHFSSVFQCLRFRMTSCFF